MLNYVGTPPWRNLERVAKAFTEDIFINEFNPPSRNSQVSASVSRGHPWRYAIQFRLENLTAKARKLRFCLDLP
jgi:hypothetical protein